MRTLKSAALAIVFGLVLVGNVFAVCTEKEVNKLDKTFDKLCLTVDKLQTNIEAASAKAEADQSKAIQTWEEKIRRNGDGVDTKIDQLEDRRNQLILRKAQAGEQCVRERNLDCDGFDLGCLAREFLGDVSCPQVLSALRAIEDTERKINTTRDRGKQRHNQILNDYQQALDKIEVKFDKVVSKNQNKIVFLTEKQDDISHELVVVCGVPAPVCAE